MEKVTTVGIDLAKSVFHLHGAEAHGARVFAKKLSRSKVMPFLVQLPPCLSGSGFFPGRSLPTT